MIIKSLRQKGCLVIFEKEVTLFLLLRYLTPLTIKVVVTKMTSGE